MEDQILNKICNKIKLINISIPVVIPITINCNELRKNRQHINYELVLKILLSKKPTESKLTKVCNIEALKRIYVYLNITFIELIQKCKADQLGFAKLISMNISKDASRQGTKDETLIFRSCNETSQKLGINIKQLSTTSYRPVVKDGRILDNTQFNRECKELKLIKNECLKSFDAQLSGKVNGWIFAKITLNNGGHQDNVFHEAHQFGEWFSKYKKENELYVIMIDTNLLEQFNQLKTKYHKDNIIVVNHIELQEYLIAKYS